MRCCKWELNGAHWHLHTMILSSDEILSGIETADFTFIWTESSVAVGTWYFCSSASAAVLLAADMLCGQCRRKGCKWVKRNVKRLDGVCVGVFGLEVRISFKRQRWCGGDCPHQKVSITWQIWVNTSSGGLSASIWRRNQKRYNVYCGTCTHTRKRSAWGDVHRSKNISPVIKFVECVNILEAMNM